MRLPTAIFPREILHSREYLAEVEANLGRLSHKPTLFLWGDRDTAFRDGEREWFERLLPNHRTRILKDAKHFVQEEAPEQICAEVIAFYEPSTLCEDGDWVRRSLGTEPAERLA